MNKENYPHLPKEYPSRKFDEKDIDPDPIKQFEKWFNEALKAELKEPNAMALATSTKTGKPSVRIVLLKIYNENGFIFFTNYESRKGNELAQNPIAALVFWWGKMGRQIRIEGSVEMISREESEEYFQSRPFESQISAWASAQSRIVENRDSLEKKYHEIKEQYEGKTVPCPPHWGGYCLTPNLFEFWQGWANRLHDRILYTREKIGWKIERLAP
jgi:pyridoxamine 5'-phosphate oxidase